MATVIDALVITLGLDPKGVQKGMTDAEKTVTGGMGKITSIIKGFAAPLAGAFAAGKLFNDWLKGADALGKFSASVGQNIEDMGAWREAVIRAGGTADGFTSSFEALNSRVAMAGAIGSGRGKKVFEQLGIALKDASGQMRDTKDILLDLADAAQKMDKAQFVGLARMLGLDAGTIRALQQGRAALEETIKYQKELGVYTEADARITADFNDRMADFRQALGAASASVFRVFVPALTAAFRYINQFIVFLRKHEKAVQAFFVILAAGITSYALPALAKLAAATLTNPFTALIAGAAALAVALEDLYVWANGGKAAFSDFWSRFGTPEEVKKKIDDFVKKLQEIGPLLIQIAEKAAPIILRLLALVAAAKLLMALYRAFMAIKTAIAVVKGAMIALNVAMAANPVGAVIAAVVALIAVLYLLYKNWDKVKDGAAKAWGAIKDGAARAWAAISGAAASAWAAVSGYAAAAWEKIKAIFAGVGAWFAGVFDAAADAIARPFAAAYSAAADAWEKIKAAFSGVGEWLAGIFSGAFDAISAPFKAAFGFISDAWDRIKSKMSSPGSAVGGAARTAVGAVAGVLRGIAGAAGSAWDAMTGAAAAAWNAITGTTAKAWDAIADTAANVWQNVTGAAASAWGAISGAAAEAWSAISGITAKAWGAMADTAASVWQNVTGAAASAWDAISGAASAAWGAITGAAADAGGRIAGALSGAWDSIVSAAAGAWQNIVAFCADVWGQIKGIFSGAGDFFAGIFSAAAAAITGPFVKAFNFISEKWQALKNLLGGGANVAAKMDIAGAPGAKTGAAGKPGAIPAAGAQRRGAIPVAVALSGNAGQSVRPSAINNSRSVNNSRHDTRVSVEKVEVVTQATDAKGIARDIGGGLQRDLSARYSANQSDAGVIQ